MNDPKPEPPVKEIEDYLDKDAVPPSEVKPPEPPLPLSDEYLAQQRD